MIGRYTTYEQYENALRQRLDSLIDLFNDNPKYPLKTTILGFPKTEIKTMKEHIGRVKEISAILHVKNPNLEINDNGTIKVMEV